MHNINYEFGHKIRSSSTSDGRRDRTTVLHTYISRWIYNNYKWHMPQSDRNIHLAMYTLCEQTNNYVTIVTKQSKVNIVMIIYALLYIIYYIYLIYSVLILFLFLVYNSNGNNREKIFETIDYSRLFWNWSSNFLVYCSILFAGP